MQQNNLIDDEHFHRLWNHPTADLSQTEVQKALETFRGNRKSYARLHRNQRHALCIVKYAAIFALPLFTAWAAWHYSTEYYAHESEMIQVYVPHGRTDSLTLSDNTRVKINSGTSIIYPVRFNNRSLNRNVYVNGSCHFAVAKDRLHPFVVNMGKLKVKVLGTHFSVDTYGDDDKIIVTLEEGLVRVTDSKQTMKLLPNEQMVYYRKNGHMQKKHIDAMAYNSWVNGNINFIGQPLGEIIKTLERRYDVKIHAAQPIDLNKRYTMNFHKGEPIDHVLEVLALASGNIRYHKTGKAIILCTDFAHETKRP